MDDQIINKKGVNQKTSDFFSNFSGQNKKLAPESIKLAPESTKKKINGKVFWKVCR